MTDEIEFFFDGVLSWILGVECLFQGCWTLSW